MSDREARALGAGESIEVNGNKYTLRPVVCQHLCDLERESLKYYKQQYLEPYYEAAFRLKDSSIVLSKLDEVARWDLDDIPRKKAHETDRMPVTDKLRETLKNLYGTPPDDDKQARNLLADALDTGQMSVKEAEALTGASPVVGKVRYDWWWVSSTTKGRLMWVTSSLRQDHKDMTEDEVAKWPIASLVSASSIVQNLTKPNMGNT